MPVAERFRWNVRVSNLGYALPDVSPPSKYIYLYYYLSILFSNSNEAAKVLATGLLNGQKILLSLPSLWPKVLEN